MHIFALDINLQNELTAFLGSKKMTVMRQYDDYRNIGSAGMLVGNQKLLFIFVDDDGATPWTHELRKPIEEKIESSLRWLEKRANGFEKPLHIMHKCLPLPPNVASNAGGHINENDYTASQHHTTWQNTVAISLTAYGSLAERWNELFTLGGLPLAEEDGSAILFCVRRNVCSVAFRYCDGQHLEFDKERGIIYNLGGKENNNRLDALFAHEILHLYGAIDLAPGKTPEGFRGIPDDFIEDVMYTPLIKEIDEYDISDLTAYLVGWKDQYSSD